jgi:hypothetical protein
MTTLGQCSHDNNQKGTEIQSLLPSQPPTKQSVSDTIIPRAAVSVAVRVQVHYKSKSSNTTSSTNATDHILAVDTTGRSDSNTTTATATTNEILQQPRQQDTFYLLIQRGTEPNIGMWTLPGGKIEYAESTFHAAQRELHEETQWWSSIGIQSTTSTPTATSSQPSIPPLRWCNQTVLTTDAIGSNYHYVIAHYFAEYPTIQITTTLNQTSEYYREPVHDTTTSAPALPVQDISNYLPNVTASDDAKNARWFTLLQIDDMENNCQNMTTPGLYHVLRRMEVLDEYRLLVS